MLDRLPRSTVEPKGQIGVLATFHVVPSTVHRSRCHAHHAPVSSCQRRRRTRSRAITRASINARSSAAVAYASAKGSGSFSGKAALGSVGFHLGAVWTRFSECLATGGTEDGLAPVGRFAVDILKKHCRCRAVWFVTERVRVGPYGPVNRRTWVHMDPCNERKKGRSAAANRPLLANPKE